MNNHCCNSSRPDSPEPHTAPPSTESFPVFSFTCTLEDRLFPTDKSVSLNETVCYDTSGNSLDGCDLQPCEADVEALPHTSIRSYDPTPGRWLQEDAVGFLYSDPNLALRGEAKGSNPVENSVEN